MARIASLGFVAATKNTTLARLTATVLAKTAAAIHTT